MVTGHRIESSEALVPTLNEGFARRRSPVDLPVDYSENHKVLIDELKAMECPQ